MGAFGALLIVAALMLYWNLRPPRPQAAVRSQVALRCTQCGADSARELPVGQVFPVRCPHCAAPACHDLWACAECDERFVRIVPPAGEMVCPKCGSARVGAATVESP